MPPEPPAIEPFPRRIAYPGWDLRQTSDFIIATIMVGLQDLAVSNSLAIVHDLDGPHDL